MVRTVSLQEEIAINYASGFIASVRNDEPDSNADHSPFNTKHNQALARDEVFLVYGRGGERGYELRGNQLLPLRGA